MERTYTIGQFAERINTTPATLRYWDKIGKVVALRTSTGRRYYTESQAMEYYQDYGKGATPNDAIIYIRADTESGRNLKRVKYVKRYLEKVCRLQKMDVVDVIVDYCYEEQMLYPHNKFHTMLAKMAGGHAHHLVMAPSMSMSTQQLKGTALLLSELCGPQSDIYLVPLEIPQNVTARNMQEIQWPTVSEEDMICYVLNGGQFGNKPKIPRSLRGNPNEVKIG